MKAKYRLNPETGELVEVLNSDGQEMPDPTPMAPPIGWTREPPLHERIRAMVQHEFNRARAEADYESPEEAEDFRLPGDDDTDPREGRFAVAPGFEDEWEDNYEPPADFKDMKQRLIDAGWTPPPAKPDRTPPEGGEPAVPGPGVSPANLEPSKPAGGPSGSKTA